VIRRAGGDGHSDTDRHATTDRADSGTVLFVKGSGKNAQEYYNNNNHNNPVLKNKNKHR